MVSKKTRRNFMYAVFSTVMLVVAACSSAPERSTSSGSSSITVYTALEDDQLER